MLYPSLIVSKKNTAPFLFCCLVFSPLPLSTLQNQLFYVPSRGPPCESSLFHICGIFVDRISHISIFPYLLPLTPVISKSLFSRENSTKSFFFTWKSDEITLIQFLCYFIILHTFLVQLRGAAALILKTIYYSCEANPTNILLNFENSSKAPRVSNYKISFLEFKHFWLTSFPGVI